MVTRRVWMTVTLVVGLALVACTPTADPALPTPSSAAPTTTPTEAPVESEPPSRFDLPVNCLSVVTPAYRGALLDAGATIGFAFGRVGAAPDAGGIDGFTDVVERRSASCWFDIDAGLEEVGYVEFDASSTQEVLDDLQAWGDAGEAYQPPGTDLALEPVDGIDEARQLVLPFENGLVKTFIVGEGWYVYVSSMLGVDDLAAPAPDASYDGASLTSDFAATQRCETMLPLPTPELDLFTDLQLHSAETTDSNGIVVCYSDLDDDLAADLWWEASAADETAQLLADAEAGVDGLGVGGSTIDGDGTLVTTSGVEVLVVFDDAIVHVTLPDGMEQGVQIARFVHAPGWLDVPPAA